MRVRLCSLRAARFSAAEGVVGAFGGKSARLPSNFLAMDALLLLHDSMLKVTEA